MPQQRFDIGSKWLLQKQGKSALLVGDIKDVQRIELMPGEIVQNRKYLDGLLRVYLASQRKPHYVLIEIATYAEKRALRQALDDDILALLKDRFDTVPRNVTKPLREILDEKKLRQLLLVTAKCPDLETFREALLS